MTKNKLLIIITSLFFAVMLFLTVFARDIHNFFLPEVETVQVQTYEFPLEVTEEDGSTFYRMVQRPGVPEKLVQSGIYTIQTKETDGMLRNYAYKVNVTTGTTHNGYTEITAGIHKGQTIIISSEKELYNGCEVYVKE